MSTVPDTWIPHRRPGDGELIGWIRPEGEHFVAVSLFGADVSPALDWVEAEEALEEVGLSWLADVWELAHEGRALRVRIVEVSPGESAARPGRVLVKTDDFGAIDVPYELHALPWPPPPELRPARPGTAASPWG